MLVILKQLTVVLCCEWHVEFHVFFSIISSLCFRATFIFLWEGEYFGLAIYPSIKLPRYYLLTENISVRLESNFCPRFRLLFVTATATSRIAQVLIVYFTTVGAISFKKNLYSRFIWD
jgi:hypothetical protein